MEEGECDAIFSSLNVNPQLFVNEILNSVDDVIDGGFEFYESQAPTLLGEKDADQLNKLSQGISVICHTVQEVLDKRLDFWEKYCRQHCFAVPKGISSNIGSSSDNELKEAGLLDAELDIELDFLREKLNVAGKEYGELQKELHALEKQTTLSKSCAEAVSEALQPWEENSNHVLFHESMRSAVELHSRIQKQNEKRRKEITSFRKETINSPVKRLSKTDGNGLLTEYFEELQEFLDSVKSIDAPK
ncbi:hypothetical protein AMTRI_Chr01g112990 [Amborella trichopoda]|uniref:Protein MIS12 homolog n=1 Tax=Amborella trichopoda TaxID=13333 RepID=W1PF19_AMBTC|nr:protein MIS12 homolog [Amborella trichopoda]XP_020523112.1 protein MIS12 homolog [Amborella trichopoda]XP_020523113.1 protein MIS12 homolog [Amborella trichopoda]ERN06568.1 hypothetical protein AMTR_s00058p00132170 [Amborella trichopoda]|eukprot:XP_006844893.1 protein MIS12 homolog [Amborella trichopoda]